MTNVPIYKVGLVVLQQGAEPKALLVRPKPKDPRETDLPWVLPRGSRRYRDARGILQDVRDDSTAVVHKDKLEPLTDTLLMEAEEEAGVPPNLLRSAKVYDLGVKPYHSSSGAELQVQWYVLPLDEAQLKQLKGPKDAARPPIWATVKEMKAFTAKEFRAGYIPVVEAAIAGAQEKTLPKVTIPPPGRTV